jgi:hypothetical protein
MEDTLSGKVFPFAGQQESRGWPGEWAIRFDTIGLKPAPGLEIAFNRCAYVNEYHNWHCWEGTLGESWQVDKAGKLLFKEIFSGK